MFGLCMLPYIGKPLLAYWMVLTYWRWNQFPLLAIHTPLLLVPNLFAITYAYKFVDIYELYFFVGLAAGYAYVKCRFGWRVWAGLLTMGALLLCRLVPAEAWGTTYGSGASFTLAISFALGAIMLGLAGLERLGVFRLGRRAGWLGAMSYPLYVVHMPILLLADNALHWGMFGARGLYAHFVLLNAGILAVAALMTFLFDQPLQRGLRRLTRRIWPAPALTPLYSANPGGTEAG
jgi:peptidoglycan/LPS O-acetylase OafA/YrhL